MEPEICEVFYGTVIHSTSRTKLEILKNAVLAVNASGKIAHIKGNIDEVALQILIGLWKFPKEKVKRLTGKQFLMPGFVDTHAHAPQYPSAGTGTDLTLLKWLKDIIYPLEKQIAQTPQPSDPPQFPFAKEVYPKTVRRLLRNGTTTAVYYATIDLEPSKYLANVVKSSGQRGFIGKVNMDINDDCEDYREKTTKKSIEDTEEFIKYVLLDLEKEIQREEKLIYPIISPRFALSCTAELMLALGELAEHYGVPIQTHLSENLDEIEQTLKLYPEQNNYTEVYDKHGLLKKSSIMGHSIYLSSEERELIKERKAGISHCPTSNFDLSSGVCNVRLLLNKGIKVGLGTDLSGGHSNSILNIIRNASIASRVIYLAAKNKSSPEILPALTVPELTYLATLGGAEVVGLDGRIGNFVLHKEFDALLIDPEAEQSPIDFFDNYRYDMDFMKVFEKFIFIGDDRNIKSVYVKGKQISLEDEKQISLENEKKN